MKKILTKSKKINHLHILIAVFLLIIFLTGVYALPTVLRIIWVWDFRAGEGAGILRNMRDLAFVLDTEYRDIHDFGGPALIDKGSYIDLNGLMARAMGQRGMNGIAKLHNGHLTADGKNTYTAHLELAVDRLRSLNEAQIEKGKSFLFVLSPGQIPKNEDIFPIGFESNSNLIADLFVSALRDNNVPVLDMREELIKDGINHTEAFYKTDHHWKTETGFWAYIKIVEYMIQMGIIDPIDSKYTDINEYNVEIYENWMLGSSGKRTGRFFAGVDDLAMITPRFDTYLSVEIPSKSISKQGDLAKVGFDESFLVLDFFNAIPYHVYGNAGVDLARYMNEKAPTDLKILGLGDSTSIVPFTFLPLVAEQTDHLDLRQFDGKFWEHYLEFDPDMVIVISFTDMPINPNTTLEIIE